MSGPTMCLACMATLPAGETHWSLMAGPAGGYSCPVVDPTPPRQTAPGTPAMDHMLVPTRLVRCEWPPNDGVLPGDPYFDSILDSIRTEGIRVPLHIHLDWRVMDGNHRLSAARLLGIEWLPVRIWTGTEWLPSAPPRVLGHPYIDNGRNGKCKICGETQAVVPAHPTPGSKP